MNLVECIKRYGEKEGTWVRDTIQGWWEDTENDDYDCVDNTRLACLDSSDELATFEDAERDGCCGSKTVTFGPSPSGRTYVYGFNYGH